jgi:hypothetical protein
MREWLQARQARRVGNFDHLRPLSIVREGLVRFRFAGRRFYLSRSGRFHGVCLPSTRLASGNITGAGRNESIGSLKGRDGNDEKIRLRDISSAARCCAKDALSPDAFVQRRQIIKNYLRAGGISSSRRACFPKRKISCGRRAYDCQQGNGGDETTTAPTLRGEYG